MLKKESVNRGAWYGVLTRTMFGVSERHAERAWPATSLTLPHGPALYPEGIEVLNGPRGCGPSKLIPTPGQGRRLWASNLAFSET